MDIEIQHNFEMFGYLILQYFQSVKEKLLQETDYSLKLPFPTAFSQSQMNQTILKLLCHLHISGSSKGSAKIIMFMLLLIIRFKLLFDYSPVAGLVYNHFYNYSVSNRGFQTLTFCRS